VTLTTEVPAGLAGPRRRGRALSHLENAAPPSGLRARGRMPRSPRSDPARWDPHLLASRQGLVVP